MKKILIVLLVLSLTSIPFVSAHPFTDETIPNLSSNAPTGVSEVIVYFSEPVELNFSTLKVLDNNGNQIDNKDTDYYEDEKSLIVTTSPLEDGVYTVTTKVLSKVDGHLAVSYTHSEPTRPERISYAVFCLKKKKTLLHMLFIRFFL